MKSRSSWKAGLTMKISIVTPCFNEEDNVELCAAEVVRVMSEKLPDYEYEHIFCDNASSDRTFEKLKTLAAHDSRIKVILNSRNVGPFRNIANGLRHTSGDLVVPFVPADLQDPPGVIPQMVAALTEHVDVVYGVRTRRRESFFLKLARGAYYALVKSNGGGGTPPPHAGEFLLARRQVIDAVIGAAGSYPYIRGLVAQTTERFATVAYAWGVRQHGKSRNSLPDLVDQALNGLVTTAKAPIRLALILGIILSIGGIVTGLVNVGVFLFGSVTASPGIPTLIVGMFLFGGIQLFFIGLIGEYVTSIHSEVSPRPRMVETAKLNF
jgi:glycosyltransferase involved in cell wall biosynthesis